MSIVIFCGPTIPQAQVRAELDADVRPPAARGDVLKAALTRPTAIGLIDGYFDRVPSVWHKEILWAMAEGVHVFGSASMGALRAAELALFGMVGIGAIFDSFRSGALVDDDEVAVAHATEEHGYRAVSEAMVNMRATFRAAQRDGVIGQGALAALEAIAKRMPYPDRRYEAVLSEAQQGPLSRAEVDALRRWLPAGRVDQKRDDAMSMLKAMAEQARVGWRPKTVDYVFAHTDAWEALIRTVRGEGLAEGRQGEASGDDIMDELLVAGLAGATLDGALSRALALELARRAKVELDPRAIEAVADDFRRERGLLERQQFDDWLEGQRLSEPEIGPFFRREATMRVAKEGVESEMLSHVADHLRATGAYGSLVSRARAKRDALCASGLGPSAPHDTRMSDDALWQWYFRERLGRPVPDDLAAYACREHTDLDRLRSAVIRERLFAGLTDDSTRIE